MNRFLELFLFLFCISLYSCNENMDCETDLPYVRIDDALISSRTDSSTGDEIIEENSFFKEGDKIVVVGASENPIEFCYVLKENSDNKKVYEWNSIQDISWKENPTTVKAFYGGNTFIDDEMEMPDLLYAEFNLEGNKPIGGVLNFTSENSFKHATALIEVKINNWKGANRPMVMLKNIHNIIAVNSIGEYITDNLTLSSIKLHEVDNDINDEAFIYQARIPAGQKSKTNILSGYSLMIDDINAISYIVMDEDVPLYFEANKKFIFNIKFK